MKKHGQARIFKKMSDAQLRDYLCVQLVIMQSARMSALTFHTQDVFRAAVLFAEHNVDVASEALKARGISIDVCHQIVNDAFLNGSPDLSPSVVDEESKSSLTEVREPSDGDLKAFADTSVSGAVDFTQHKTSGYDSFVNSVNEDLAGAET